TATTIATKQSPPVTNLAVAVLGHGDLPKAKPVDLPQLARSPGGWVEMVAEARVAEVSRGRLVLVLYNQGNRCQAFVMGAPPPAVACKKYLGARVRLRGVNTSRRNEGGSFTSELMVPGLRQVTLVEQPGWLAGELPVLSTEALLNREL